MLVHGPGAAAGLDVDQRHADCRGAGGLAQGAEGGAHLADVAYLALDLVPMRERHVSPSQYSTCATLKRALIPRSATLPERGKKVMSLGSRVLKASRLSGASPARKACATPVPGGRATTLPGRTTCSSAPSSSVPSPSRTKKVSSSAAWQCGGPLRAPGATTMWATPVRLDPSASPSSRRTTTTSPPPVKSSAAMSSSATIVGGRCSSGS